MVTTRQRILDVAAGLFGEQGYDGTSLREIAEHMGFSKAALYYHFQSKEDILRALLEPIGSMQEEMVLRLEASQTLEDWAATLAWAVDLLFDNMRVFSLLTRNRAAVETLASDSDFFSEHQRWHERVEEAIARSGLTLDQRVRIVCALGAVGGFDDFGGQTMIDADPAAVRDHIVTVIRQILGLPKARRAHAARAAG